MAKVVIAGSRHITDYAYVWSAIQASGWYWEIGVVIHGGQVTRDERGNPVGGVDWLAGQWAAGIGLPVHVYPADWKRHGRAAGPIRNRQMAADGDRLIAVPHPTLPSRGTRDMVRAMEAAGKPVFVYEPATEPERGRGE